MTTDTDLAREGLYRFLSAALAGPRGAGWPLLLDPSARQFACEAAALLRADAAGNLPPLGFGELPADLLTLEPLCARLEEPDDMAAEYVRVFGLVTAPECMPYETEYHPTEEPFFRAQQMADVAGFYRAFGLDTSHRFADRPDHLALELEFMALLLTKRRLAGEAVCAEAAEHAAVCAEAEAAFFRDHLAWWVPSFATGLRRKAGSGFLAALGQVLAALMPLERKRLGVPSPRLPLRSAAPEPAEEVACAGCAV